MEDNGHYLMGNRMIKLSHPLLEVAPAEVALDGLVSSSLCLQDTKAELGDLLPILSSHATECCMISPL